MNILKYIKEWWLEGDVHFDFQKKEIDFDNSFGDYNDSKIDNDIKKKCNIGKSTIFFDKIARLKLDSLRKNEVAKKIVDDSNPNKIYWIQLFLSCIISAIGLFMNSIPVIIGAMLISPLLDPIKAFAFAITNGHKSMYLRSIKILFLSIFVAIFSSVFVSFIIPFSHITSEMMLRVSPTMVDLFVAFFSGAIAFLFLGFKRLEESIAGVAIAVALLPSLSVVGIGLFFLDLSIAQGSFLLFFTNLVAILTIGTIVFYLFGFFPTNKSGQKRSFIILLMVIFSLLLISFPLQKSMSKISNNMKITSQVNNISKSYFDGINNKISIDKINFKNILDDIVRVSAVLSVPSNIVITNEHKDDLTKLLSLSIEKSVELDLSIVEISSIYIGDDKTKEDILISYINNLLMDNFSSVFVLDYNIIEQDGIVLFLNLYTNQELEKQEIYNNILLKTKEIFGDLSNVIIQWQTNKFTEKNKTEKELELERQFYLLFSGSNLNSIKINNLSKALSGNDYKYVGLDLNFITPYNSFKIKSRLRDWKIILEQYFDMEVVINSRVEYFSNIEI